MDRTGASIRAHPVATETGPHPIPGQLPRPTRFPRTIRRVWPEGDLDLKLPVGIFDGGKWQEGVGSLGEVGYHSLCREKTVRETSRGRVGVCCPLGLESSYLAPADRQRL